MLIIEIHHNTRRKNLSAIQELMQTGDTGIERKLKYGKRTQFTVSLNS